MPSSRQLPAKLSLPSNGPGSSYSSCSWWLSSPCSPAAPYWVRRRPVLAGTLVTLMILLRKLDQLRWHERVSIWEPATRLFRSMGRDPYIPRHIIVSGRYRPTGRVWVVDLSRSLSEPLVQGCDHHRLERGALAAGCCPRRTGVAVPCDPGPT